MKQRLITTIAMVMAGCMSVAQTPADSAAADLRTVPPAAAKTEKAVIFPRSLVGVRLGANLSDMTYSHPGMGRYTHHMQLQGVGGIFGHFHLGRSNFAIRPEVAVAGRADSLDWLDVRYSLKARYIDLRLPITYNIRFKNCPLSPYLMAAPHLNVAYGGTAYYRDEIDFRDGIAVPVTKADINGLDAGLMAGIGFDLLLRTGGMPVLLSLEAGYSWGLTNTFAPREVLDNPNVAESRRSTIANPFFGAGLWQGERRNRGLEVALRVAIHVDGSWKERKEPLQQADTVYVPTNDCDRIDTVYVIVKDSVKADTVFMAPDTVFVNRPLPAAANNGEYLRKDCYTFSEMLAFLTLGIDISDKRMCLFNINFDFDSYRLRPEALQPLDDVAQMMKNFPEMRIKIIGHTDDMGNDSYNDRLSKSRAKSVADYIGKKGVDRNRIETEGYGEKYPIDTNETPEGRHNNRRVEIDVLNVGMRITDSKTSTDNK